MPSLNTTSVSLAVTPTVVSTLFSHYLNKKSKRQRPTAHLSYDEGLHLIRSFLDFASHHTVEELQAFTAQWVPHPQWVKVKEDVVTAETLSRAASLLQTQLGDHGLSQVGGREWWQWRKEEKKGLEVEWIEMRTHAQARKKLGQDARRVMMYVHGGAYFFGSVDEHRYQMQRHARKLRARVFAPRYRLAPQFPFPCGLHDCLAAYLHLLQTQDPSTIVLAGDSAGGGMVMAMMVVLRDQGLPLPAGAILISPWVDLTHSFPSVAGEAPFDYIPQAGFHHKPSRSWPPPNEDDERMLREAAGQGKQSAHILKDKQQNPVTPKAEDEIAEEKKPEETGGIMSKPEDFLSIHINGEDIIIKEQIQMYTTNLLLEHPLVSPVMQPTLGGLPPLLIMVGGGEILRDEQIFLAHKCANPQKYAPPSGLLTDHGAEQLARYRPTDVQLQVWDDLCHVAPTLSFTRPAKHMYRSVAQFGAWALARAQKRGIDIMDDDEISVISSHSATETDRNEEEERKPSEPAAATASAQGAVGKAGDPLPRFQNHMIRQRVTRHGVTLPLVPESELPACTIDREAIGKIKQGPVCKWLATKKQWDARFASSKAKVHKRIISDMKAGYQPLPAGEKPPPTALAGRRRVGETFEKRGKRKSLGLAVWSLWGSKHDEETVEREKKVEGQQEGRQEEGEKEEDGDRRARGMDDGRGDSSDQQAETESFPPVKNENDQGGQLQRPAFAGDDRSRSRRRTVVDEHQTEEADAEQPTPVSELVQLRKAREESIAAGGQGDGATLAHTQKRPHVGGIAVPFSVKREAETASMVTLNSGMSRPASPGVTPGETKAG